MSTDRELLELAAKAAGMDGYEYNDGYTNAYYAGSKFYMTQNGRHTPWNPLEDDGDAMRLVVKLGLSIHRQHNKVAVFEYEGNTAGYLGGWSCLVVHESDESITRRAIVRAAAEIGKAMP